MRTRLSVIRLALLAPGAVYDARFHDGVNVIAGPISTGKSSVLALIDYALGASSRPKYPEISKCSDVLLECDVAGERLVVQRSLHSVNRKARVYQGTIDDVLTESVDGEEVSAVHDPGDKSISRELLRRLRLDNIKVKTAPTQPSSDLSTFSLRDLMHFLYVDQDRIDSPKSGFFEQQPPLAIKWRAAFEILASLYDDVAAGLSASLNECQSELAGRRQYLDNVRTFLQQSRVPIAEDLRREIENLDAERRVLDARVGEARSATETRRGQHLELARRRDALSQEIERLEAKREELTRSLRQLGKLRVQYSRERAQLEFLKESESLVGSLPVVRCPVCLQLLEFGTEDSPDGTCHLCHRAIPTSGAGVDVERRLTSLKRRVADLEAYVRDLAAVQTELETARRERLTSLEDIDSLIHRLEPAALFPEMREMLQLEAAIGLTDSKLRQRREQLALRQRAEDELKNISIVEDRIRALRDDLEERQANRPSRDEVVSQMSSLFAEVLRNIQFPDSRGARIDARLYIPIVRDQAYGELSSKGAIALAVCAWHLAALRYFLTSGGLFPSLFLIDSPLSNVGHDAVDKDFRDQRIVDAFYELLADLHCRHGLEFQLIVVDNRPPSGVDEFVVLRFSGDPTKGRYGLVADEIAPPSTAAEPEGPQMMRERE